VNGLLAVNASDVAGAEFTVYLGYDWRMWLHVLAAYGQFAVVLPIAASVAKRLERRRRNLRSPTS